VRLPAGISFLAIVFIILGLFGVLWGIAMVGFGGLSWLAGAITVTESAQVWGADTFWVGLLDLVTGAGKIIAGLGLLGGHFWAWLLSVILAVIWFIGPLFSLFRGNWFSLFGLIIPGAILFYLLSPRIRQVFVPAAQ
jgi:hypothetical protein